MTGLIASFKSKLPTREWIATSRWTRPFARHLLRPDLWRFNRRSVPRAVAVGLLIAPVVPVAHTLLAALAAVPTRANIVIAAAVTWLINPFTFFPFYYAASNVGHAILQVDRMSPMPQVTHQATMQATSWLPWLFDKTGEVALGTLVMAVVIASVGYLVSSLVWRWNIGRKWRARSANRARSN